LYIIFKQISLGKVRISLPLLPLSVGASGKRAMPSSTKFTDFTSTGLWPKRRSNLLSPKVGSKETGTFIYSA